MYKHSIKQALLGIVGLVIVVTASVTYVYAGSLAPTTAPAGTMASLDAIAGTGFATGTDSLKVIDDQLDLIQAKTDTIPNLTTDANTMTFDVDSDNNGDNSILTLKIDNSEKARLWKNDSVYEFKLATDTTLVSSSVIASGTAGTDGEIKIYSEQGETDYWIVFRPHAAMTTDTTYTLPPDDGTASQYLQTDGNGALVWADVAAASKALDNLTGVAINASLIPDSAGDTDLGSEALFWQKLYVKSAISFEGATIDDGFQTTLDVTTPTADQAITLPNATGTVALINGTSGQYSGAHDFSGTTLEIPNGTSLPGECTIGQLFADTDSDDCVNTGGGNGALCICKTADNWAIIFNF